MIIFKYDCSSVYVPIEMKNMDGSFGQNEEESIG